MEDLQLPPSRPRTGGTPNDGRRVRQAVGFTNRSRPATAVSRSKDEIGHVVERPGTSSGHNERPRTLGSSGSQRPSTRVQQRERHDLFAEHTGYSGMSMRGTMVRPATADKQMQRRVREKILRHRLNLGPLLRPYADEAGCVAPEGMRNALAGAPQLALTNDELDFCTGPGGAGADSKIHVHNFLLSLNVPSYDDNYDPWGKSRARETRLLCDRVSNLPTRTFSHKSFEVPEKLVFVPPKPAEEDETAGVKLGTQPSKPNHKPGAGIARKYLKQIGDQMEVKGLDLLDIFRKIDIDSSGTIDQSEFEEAVHVIGVPGIEAPQMAFLFRNIDENGNGKVDIHELKNALTEAQIDDSGGSQPSRPSTFRPEGTGSLSNEPWANRTNGTRIPSLLPADHFNIRFRRSLMPPYATSETVVPIKTTFAYNPEHLRYTTVTLSNQWLTDGTGQARDIQKSRQEARIQRKRDVEARMRSSVETRDKVMNDMDAIRLGGLSRTRASWMSKLTGAWV